MKIDSKPMDQMKQMMSTRINPNISMPAKPMEPSKNEIKKPEIGGKQDVLQISNNMRRNLTEVNKTASNEQGVSSEIKTKEAAKEVLASAKIQMNQDSKKMMTAQANQSPQSVLNLLK